MDRVKLGSLCLQITDGEHGTVKDNPEGTFYYLNNNNITESGIEIRDGDRRIDRDTFSAIRRRTNLEQNDVVIATCGTLGKTQVIRSDPDNYEFSRSVGMIKPNPSFVLADYIHYYFTLPASQLRIQQIATGGVQKHFYIEDMANFDIDLPSLETQRAVVDVLRSIDGKIANNKKLMAELEETARLIYDYWFTQFDFPDEHGKPYRSSGGKMVRNESLKYSIPKGWQAGTLASLGEIISGATPSTAIPTNYAETGIAWITPNDLSDSDGRMHIGHGERDISEQGLKACSAQLMPPGSVIMSSRAPIGYLAVSTEQCCTNQGCKSLIPKNGYEPYFIFLTMKRRMPIIKAQGVGTTFTEVSKDTLASIPLELPPTTIAAQFEELVMPLCTQIKALEQESKELSALRDWLLPMLMNGQATIRE